MEKKNWRAAWGERSNYMTKPLATVERLRLPILRIAVVVFRRLARGLVTRSFASRRVPFLLAGLAIIFSTQFAPLRGAEPEIQIVNAVIAKIQTSARKQVTFTPKGSPKLEIVNNRLNIAVNSSEGMVFELVGIPAKDGIAARRYRGPEFRALLLHSPFQEEAASDDPFEDASILQIQKPAAGEAGAAQSVVVVFSGKLRAGTEVLDVHFQFSGLLPGNRKFIAPNK